VLDGTEPDAILVVLRDTSFDRQVPPELRTDLGLDDSRVLRVGSAGFTAALTPGQRAAAERHPLVERTEPDPDRLAPFIGIAPDPRAPDRYTAMLIGGDPLDVARAIGLGASQAVVTGVWLTARLTADQLLAVRRDPRVDFVDFAIMDGPA
jgi:hypothetical protein